MGTFWSSVAACNLKVVEMCVRWEILLQAFESQALGMEVQQ